MYPPQVRDGDIRVETDEGTAVFSASELRTRGGAERRIEIACASGERVESVWQGLPVSTLVAEVSFPDETTHLSFTSRDDYRCCVDIRTALDGLLAVVRDGEPLGESRPYETRFVAPDVEGARCLKDVRTVRPRSLVATEDRTDYEQLDPDEDDEQENHPGDVTAR
ncbi:MAG: molybdopterin-dependent oxidoreductase [Haloarculaceae archaeon]